MRDRPACRPLLAWTALALFVASASPAAAFTHQTSKVRFLEYSPAVFDRARQEEKPVFMLISAVWCYWCKFFEEHTLKVEGVSDYLNRSYLSVFVDYDRRPDLVRKYVRGIPMIVLFAPDGRVRQSFAGALKKEDFLAVLARVEGEVRSELAMARPAEPAAGTVALPPRFPVSGEAYRQLLDGLARYVDEQADATYGGFGVASKAPHGRLLRFLLEQGTIRGDRHRWAAVEKTLGGILRTLYDAKDGGFYGSQTADPAYYRLTGEGRRANRKPPVNRDKIAAANAEAILAFLAISQTTGRQDLKEAAFRSLEFMRRHLLTDKGVHHFYEAKARRGHLRGQLEANAWTALAFLEGHRVSGQVSYRRAAEQLLGYALAELFDPARGAFEESNNPDEPGSRSREIPLDANGVMAWALVRGHQATGRAEYLEITKRVLAALGAEVKTALADEPETPPVKKVADTVFYLKAYGQVVRKP